MKANLEKIILAADSEVTKYIMQETIKHLSDAKYNFETILQQGPQSNNNNDPTSSSNNLKIYQTLADYTKKDPINVGILLTGSGVGANYEVNKIKGIRAALAHCQYIGDMCRKHNNANILILPTHCVGLPLLFSIIDTFMNSGFDGEPRNRKRIELIGELQEGSENNPLSEC